MGRTGAAVQGPAAAPHRPHHPGRSQASGKPIIAASAATPVINQAT